jgi:hypothetical protein
MVLIRLVSIRDGFDSDGFDSDGFERAWLQPRRKRHPTNAALAAKGSIFKLTL